MILKTTFGDQGDVIINTGSIVSTLDMPTALVYTQTKYAEKWHISKTPPGRVGKLQDIAQVAVFLASEGSYLDPW